MAKISEYNAVTSIAGTEQIPVVQGGTTKRATAREIANSATVLQAFTSGTHTPTTDDGAALGSLSFRWSDVFLAPGAVINWAGGDVTTTHSTGLLTFSGGLAMTTLAASGAATLSSTLAVTGMATLTGGLKGGVQTLSGAGAINLTTPLTRLVTTGANALTLADGSEGQLKAIVMLTDGGDGTLTPTNFGNGTTITFNDVGDSVLLVFLGTDWWIVSNNGCTVA
jgi:hypothetical protein